MVTEPVTEPVTELVTELVTEPVTEPLTEPVEVLSKYCRSTVEVWGKPDGGFNHSLPDKSGQVVCHSSDVGLAWLFLIAKKRQITNPGNLPLLLLRNAMKLF